MENKETLEEAFSNYGNEKYHSPTQGSNPDLESVKFGAKWQAERSYSEEEVINIIKEFDNKNNLRGNINNWFEQFKKK